jgi:hypothetical protein
VRSDGQEDFYVEFASFKMYFFAIFYPLFVFMYISYVAGITNKK